jgi:hypothetical protein
MRVRGGRVFLIFEFHTFFIFFLDQAVIRLEGLGSVSALVVSLDPVVVAANPLHRRFRHRRWSRSIRLSLRFGVSSSASRPRSRSFNRFAHGRRRLVVGHSCSSSSHRAVVLKSHHDRPSVPLKGTSRRRTASWSRNFRIVESRIHSVSVVIRPFTVVTSGCELGPLDLILVLLSAHRLFVLVLLVTTFNHINKKYFNFIDTSHKIRTSSYFWLYPKLVIYECFMSHLSFSHSFPVTDIEPDFGSEKGAG